MQVNMSAVQVWSTPDRRRWFLFAPQRPTIAGTERIVNHRGEIADVESEFLKAHETSWSRAAQCLEFQVYAAIRSRKHPVARLTRFLDDPDWSKVG